MNTIHDFARGILLLRVLQQKIPAKSFLALFVSFIGVYFISSQGKPFNPGDSDLLGVILAAGSSIFWALYFIMNMRDSRQEGVKLLLNFSFATLYILILLLASGKLGSFSSKGIWTGVYIGIFEMGLTFFLWLKALNLAKSSDKIANLVFLAPFLSLIFITIILKEHIHYTTFVGLFLIIGSIVVQRAKGKEQEVRE